jgi:hypothetical protein
MLYKKRWINKKMRRSKFPRIAADEEFIKN